MRMARPIRFPWPGDMRLDGVPVMLGKSTKDQSGLIIERQPDFDQVQPTDFDYGSTNPKYERRVIYERFPGGFGQQLQEAFEVSRYFYTVNADLSVWPWVKGPLVTSYTPSTIDATNGITKIVEMGSVLYAVNGRYVLTYNGANFNTVTVDLDTKTAGAIARDAVVFYSAGLSSQYMFIAASTGNFIYWDGVTWTVATGANMDRRCFLVAGKELYGVRDVNMLCKVSTDSSPVSALNWVDIGRIGDKSSAVNRMAVLPDGTFLAFKTDGIYTIDLSTYEDVQLFPSLSFAADANNAKGFGAFLNDYLVPYRQGLYKIGTGPSASIVGPELQLDSADSPVRGRITAFAAHDTLFGVGAIYNGTDSYLMKLLPNGIWHGSISEAFTSKYATHMFKSTVSAKTAHARMWIGWSNGTISYFTLNNDAYPAADADYDFSTADGYAYMPYFTGGFGSDTKSLSLATVSLTEADASRALTIDYKLDVTDTSWTAMGENFDSVPRDRAEFPDDTSTTMGAFRFGLVNGAITASPQISGVAIHFYRRTNLVRNIKFVVLADNGLLYRSGAPFRISASQIRTIVRNAYNRTSSVTIYLPDESSLSAKLVDYRETMAWDDRQRRWLSGIEIEATEMYGTTLSDGTYGAMELLTYGALEALTYSGIENLSPV